MIHVTYNDVHECEQGNCPIEPIDSQRVPSDMSNQIPGEVLVPASRFLPKCEHDDAHAYAAIVFHGATQVVSVEVRCGECTTPYEQELPYTVEGAGNAVNDHKSPA